MMNIPEKKSVECSESENLKGPLPAPNLDMSGRSPQFSREGFGKGSDDVSNIRIVCSR